MNKFHIDFRDDMEFRQKLEENKHVDFKIRNYSHANLHILLFLHSKLVFVILT